ncbi:sodium/calcium exchanger 1-like [Dysidea avara]|uniref:sodium/calcium exchanger 1-like n=1 Tax=Dysidea avara TaxID=196820 RepID=UPI00332EC4F6
MGYHLQLQHIQCRSTEDYNGTRITVDVPAGVLTRSFAINIIDNDVVECDEVFSVTIESVITCGVTTGDVISSNVTIMDNDEAALSLNQTEYSVSEVDGQLPVGVTLSRVTSQDVTVLITITDGTTTGGEDYNVTQQSLLIIPAGLTSSLYSVDIINDMIHEDDETFDITITLMTTCLSISGDHNVATVTILDDEAPTITFNQSTYTINEDDGLVTIVLILSNPSTTDITVQVLTTDGSATGEYGIGEVYDKLQYYNRRRC